MGSGEFSKPKEKPINEVVVDKFIDMINDIEFDDDEVYHKSLEGVISECNARIDSMKGDVEETSRD